jgi:hypothetical protein
VDCGGTQCNKCPASKTCAANSDCISNNCIDGNGIDGNGIDGNGIHPSCSDGFVTQGESDVDCGGPNCAPCPDGKDCNGTTDCESATCTSGTCTSCEDNKTNQRKSDVDCGGDHCETCIDGKSCGSADDCTSARCTGGTCTSCNDDQKNGNEVDVDCGGACEQCITFDDVEVGTDTGYDPAIAATTSGEPRIVFFNNTEDVLKRAASSDRENWTTTVIGPGEEPKIAVDASGASHIGYEKSGKVRYADSNGGAWQLESVADASGSDIAVDSSGGKHIVDKNGSGIHYTSSGASWTTALVDGADTARTAIAVDAQGNPHIVYRAGGVKYAYHDGIQWHVETISTNQKDYADVSIAVDASGTPHVAFVSSTNSSGSFGYTVREGSIGKNKGSASGGFNAALALDADGEPHVVHDWDLLYRPSAGSFTHHLKYSRWEDGSFKSDNTAPITYGYYFDPAITVDAAGNAHVAYTGPKRSAKRRLTYFHVTW